MKKKILLLLMSLLAVGVLAACVSPEPATPAAADAAPAEAAPEATPDAEPPDEEPADDEPADDEPSDEEPADEEPADAAPVAPISENARIVLGVTEAFGEEAIPAAFDVYSQIMALFEPGHGIQSGYDADFIMHMVMEMEVDGMSASTTISTTTGNMRANIDGDLMQSAAHLTTSMVMELEGMTFPMEMDMGMYMEIDGDSITFFRVVVDGELFDDPMMAEMLDMIPEMNIPEFGLDAILDAEITQVGDEVYVVLALDAGELSEFIDLLMGDMMGELTEMMDMGMEMHLDNLYIAFVIGADDSLSRMIMELDMYMVMEMEGHVVSIWSSVEAVYMYNHVGSVEINMPGR